MNKKKTFFSDLKHLGPVQIHLDNKQATIVSMLGVDYYNFHLLPNDRDNQNAILQLAFKTHLNDNIEGFDDLKSIQSQKIKFFDLFSKFNNTMKIEESGNIEDKLKGLIMKDFKEFSVIDFRDFNMIENSDNILENCIPPIVIRFSDEFSLINNSNTTEVMENEISQLNFKKVHATKETQSIFAYNLVKVEIKNFITIKKQINILKQLGVFNLTILSEMVKIHYEIIERLKNHLNFHSHDIVEQLDDLESTDLLFKINTDVEFIKKECDLSNDKFYFNLASNESTKLNYDLMPPKDKLTDIKIKDVLQNSPDSISKQTQISTPVDNIICETRKDQVTFNSQINQKSNKLDVIDSSTTLSKKDSEFFLIGEVYLSMFDKIKKVYSDFIKEYEEIVKKDNIELSVENAYVILINYLTNHSNTFKTMMQMNDIYEIKKAYLKSLKLNTFLNLTAEKASLDKLAMKVMQKNSIFEDLELKSVLECKNNDKLIFLYLGTTDLLIVDENAKLIKKHSINDINIFLYNMNVLIIPTYLKSSSKLISKKPENSKFNIVMLKAINREVTKEFILKFQEVKYSCESTDGFLFIKNNINITDEYKENEILIELVNKEDKVVRIEGMIKKYDTLCQQIIFEDIKQLLMHKKIKMSKMYENRKFLCEIIKITSENAKIVPFSFDFFPEEEASFIRKKEILKELSFNICGCRNIKNSFDFKVTHNFSMAISSFLFSNDVIEKYNLEIQEYLIKKYIALLESNIPIDKIVDTYNLEELVALFSMVIQHNIYYFFTPNEIEKFNRINVFDCLSLELDLLKPSSKKYLSTIGATLRYLKDNSIVEHMNMIFKSMAI